LAQADEQVTAYYILDCETVDRAQEIAASDLDFHVVAIEVREVHDWLDASSPE
jgi:hypothetical protein